MIRRRRGSEDDGAATGAPGGGSPERRVRAGRPAAQAWGPLSLLNALIVAPLRFLTGFNGEIDAQAAVEFFLREYQRKLVEAPRRPASAAGEGGNRDGEDHDDDDEDEAPQPRFRSASYHEALTEAIENEKLLLVYLHSSQHPDTAEFCRTILGAPEIAALINSSMVAWGGCVEFEEAHWLSEQLSVASFPYVGVIEPPPNTRSTKAKLVECLEGLVDSGLALAKLTRAADHYGSIIAGRVAQRYEANERQRLREEQDEALRLSLEQDRRRAEERRAKEEQELKARMEQAEKENLRRAEEEEARQAEQDRVDEIKRKRDRMLPEPEEVRGETTSIRFQMPSGLRFQRRFLKGDTLQYLRDFVDCELLDREATLHNYAVVLNFPKKIFGPDYDHSQTLEECDLVPQAVLFIQDLDS